jgi:hypothetical protein
MIVTPDKMDFSDKNIIMIISGLPGVGKTTLALSAPNVVLIDADEGMARVNPAHRKPSSICKTYEELLADVKACEGKFDTVVIDTCGALIDMMKDWAMRTEPATACKKSGGISMQGFGIVKTEFLRLSAELRKKFNVIFLFHAAKDKQGDDVFFDIICEGSAKTLVWQPADLGAYLHIVNGERYLGFTPTMNYSAKAAYGIKGLVKVPELGEGDKNDFLTKLFAQVKSNLKKEAGDTGEQKKKYEEVMAFGKEAIALVTPDNLMVTFDSVKKLPVYLTSKDELQTLMKQKIAELGLVWNKEKKQYVPKETEK